MNMFDEAIAIRKMLSVRDMTQAKLAAVLGVSQPYIANKLRLLNFTDRVQKRIVETALSERHARTLLRLKDEDSQLEAIEKIKVGKMNVARCEIMVDCMLDKEARSRIAEANSAERIGSFEKALASSLSILREFGFKALSTREQLGDNIYFSICISK